MPQNKTLLGGSAAGGVALLQPHVKNVIHAFTTGQWTQEALDSEAAIYTAAAMSALGVLLVARDRVVDHIQHGGIPQVRLRGPFSWLWSWLAPRVEPRPRVTPEPESKDEIVALPREEPK